MATSGLSNDTRNFQCVTVASAGVIKLPLRDILARHIQPKDLFQKIQSCTTLKLRCDQLKVCFIPPPGVPDYNKFDVTLLYALIRNLCSLPSPAQGWGNEPKATDTQISDDIERLRLFRNNYYAHAESAVISDAVFKDVWKNLKLVFRRIQPKTGCSVDYEEELINIESTKFTDDYLTTFRVLLEALAKLEKQTDGRDEPDIFIEGENEIVCGGTAQFKAEVKKIESSFWSIKWRKRKGDVIKCINTNIEKYSGSTKRKLVIKSVCKEDEGEYQAVLSLESNGPEYKSRNTIRLHAIGEKPFLKISDVVSGSKGINIHYNCGVLEQSPEVHHIEWSKNGQPLDNNKKYVGGGVHDRHFTIMSPTFEDRGNYSCKVTNAVGFLSKNVILDVPSVELLEVLPVCCGYKTTIKSVISSTPTPKNLEWQKSKDGVDFHTIREAKDFKSYESDTCSSLVIHKATFADKLYYRLLVQNCIGESISNTVYLNVTGNPPYVTIIPETNIKNRSVKLFGNVIIYDDSPGIQDFFWTRNEKTIDFEETDGKLSETRTDNPSLTITNVSLDDAGEYQLTAINAVGSFTSEAIILGAPCVSEEKTEDEKNGGQWITVTINSIPAPCHVQWSAKGKEEDTFTPIDINAEEYEGTTVTLPHPVLFVRQQNQLEKNCFRIEVTNFIGKTGHDISGNDTTRQRKIDSVENTIYNDDGEIFKFTMFSNTIVKLFPPEKLDDLKFSIKNSKKVKNLTSVAEAASVLKCIEILQDENLFTQKDVIYMQFLCQEADCIDLFKKCIEYAEKQKALCYFQKPLVNGYKNVEFHVQGDVSGYSRGYIHHVIKTVAVFLKCKEEDIMLNGVRHSESFLISLSVKEIYIWKLLILEEKDRIKLKRLNIDYLIIDGKIIHLERPKVSLLTMDHKCRYQGVLRCFNCDTLDPPLYCDICHVHLCKNCGEKHFSDASTKHTMVVPFKSRESATKCQKHISEICERYCEQCEIPVCVQCAFSLKHLNHKFVDVEEKLVSKKLVLQKDLQELEKSIYPEYQEIAYKIPVQKAELNKNSRKLTTAISKHGKDLHREIDTAITKMKADVIEIESKHMAVLNKHEDEIKRSLFEITKSIAEVKKLLDSEDVCHVTAYKSRNAEFRKLSPKFEVSLPSFTPQKINKENINQYVGSLSVLPEHGNNTMDAQGTESSPLSSPLIDEARVITGINIKCEDSILLTNVSCLSDALIWTCSIKGNIMLLCDLLGELVESVRTKSGRKPEDIAVTKNGDLVYTDYSDGSVNIVKNKKIQTVVRLRDWRPRGVCSTNSGDLLVVMERDDDDEEIKIMRYNGSIEKKIIQYNNKGQFLPKGEFSNKYISENRNFDICVSDYRASAVVVFNQAGKRRFNYTGHYSTTKEPFYPCGITTDSQSRILTAEVDKGRIHILDQNGQFLRYIDNCDLHSPWGLCVDTRDNLFVTEFDTGKVKKIKYCIY